MTEKPVLIYSRGNSDIWLKDKNVHLSFRKFLYMTYIELFQNQKFMRYTFPLDNILSLKIDAKRKTEM